MANVIDIDDRDCNIFTSLLLLLPVVGLGPRGVEASGLGPIVELSVVVGGIEPDLVGRPEPSVDVLGAEPGGVASVEVAETAGGPDVLDAYKGKKSKKESSFLCLFFFTKRAKSFQIPPKAARKELCKIFSLVVT